MQSADSTSPKIVEARMSKSWASRDSTKSGCKAKQHPDSKHDCTAGKYCVRLALMQCSSEVSAQWDRLECKGGEEGGKRSRERGGGGEEEGEKGWKTPGNGWRWR